MIIIYSALLFVGSYISAGPSVRRHLGPFILRRLVLDRRDYVDFVFGPAFMVIGSSGILDALARGPSPLPYVVSFFLACAGIAAAYLLTYWVRRRLTSGNAT